MSLPDRDAMSLRHQVPGLPGARFGATLPRVAEDIPEETALQVVATAGSEPEADVIRQRLESAGISSVAQRTIGGPEWGASGSRYVYVRAHDLERARDLLGLTGTESDTTEASGDVSSGR